MHQLLLLRHAKASSDGAALSDRDRPLTAGGHRAAATMRHAMRELGIAPDLILVSPAKRTMETIDALEPWDDTPLVEPLEELYLASADRLLTTLQAVAETVRTVLVAGHNPGLHDLAVALTGNAGPGDALATALRTGFPTTALAVFSLVRPWSGLAPGSGRLIRFLTPRALNVAD